MAAIIIAAIASSVLTFVILIVTGKLAQPTGPDIPLQIVVFLSIVFIWGPAFAFIPAALLGFVVERPLVRRLVARRQGGFVEHLLAVLAAALVLWLLVRLVVVATGPQTQLLELESLAVFTIIGICSAFSWWFVVILPERSP